MGPKQILRMLKARWLVIAVLTLLGAIAGAATSKLLPSRYEARSRVVVDLLKADPVTGEALPPRTLDTFLAAQVELIRDPRVARRVVDHFGWERSQRLRGAYAAASPAPSQGLRDWLAADVAQRTRATLIRNSPILEIVYTSSVPDTARRGADAVRGAFLTEALDSKRRDAAQKAEWFDRQAGALKTRLAAAEARKATFERANNIVLQDDNIDAESSRLRALASSAPAPVAAMVATPVVAASAGQLAQVDAQLAAARQSLGMNHPEIIALQQQRGALTAAVARELAGARAAAHVPASGGSGGALSAQTRKVLAQRGLVDEARRLAGDVVVLRDQVAKTMQRAADFELQAQATEAGFGKLGAAATPRNAVSPGRWLLIGGGAVAGLILGMILSIVMELLARRVRGPEDLRLERLPIIGAMPVARRRRKSVFLGSKVRPRRVATA